MIDLNNYTPVYINENKLVFFKKFVNKVETELKKNNKTIDDVVSDKQFWLKIFKKNGTATAYPMTSYKAKQEYAKELEEIIGKKFALPSFEECSKSSSKTELYLFRNIQHFIECVDTVGRVKIPNYSTATMLLDYKCWGIMAWCQVKTEEALGMKAENLLMGEDGSYYLLAKRGKVKIYRRLYDILMKASTTYEDYSSSGYKKFFNKGDSNIFKSSLIGKEKTTIHKFTYAIREFNKILEEICGKVFDYTAMSRVRLFNDIHSDTTDITFTEKVRKYYANPSVLDSSRVVKIKAEYRAWMNMYYPNEEVK